MLFVNPTGLGAGAGWGAVSIDHGVVWNWFAVGIAIEFATLIGESLGVIREVLEGWVLGVIAGPGIDSVSAWVDLASEDFADGLSADGAWGTHPKDSTDLIIFEGIALEGVTGVDEDDDLVEFLLNHLKHVNLVIGELEEVLVRWSAALGVTGVHGLKVSTFGTGTDDDDDSSVIVIIEAGFDSVGVASDWGLTNS